MAPRRLRILLRGKHDETEIDNVNILVVKARRSRCYAVIAVPQNIAGPEQYAVKSCLNFLDLLGYNAVI